MGAVTLVIVFVLIMIRRARTPLRELLVGHGSHCDVDLGGGASKSIFRLRVFKDDRIQLVLLSSDQKVTINGGPVKSKQWLTKDDEVRIQDKLVVFS